MVPDSTAASDAGTDHEVMASVDGEGATRRYVIADIAVEDAWLSVRDADAVQLPAWR